MARFSAIQWADRWLLCDDNFFGLVAGRFCWGICENEVFWCGFFVVGVWWKVCLTWSVSDTVSIAKNFPLF
jgi:hypothetical protein